MGEPRTDEDQLARGVDGMEPSAGEQPDGRTREQEELVEIVTVLEVGVLAGLAAVARNIQRTHHGHGKPPPFRVRGYIYYTTRRQCGKA